MKQVISKTPLFKSYKEALKPKLIDMLSKIYTCLKYEEQKVYEFMYDLTLAEEYVIFSGKKKEKEMMKERKKDMKKSIKFEDKLQKENMTVTVNGEKQGKKKKKKDELDKNSANPSKFSLNDPEIDKKHPKEKQIRQSNIQTGNLLRPPDSMGTVNPVNPATASINNISMKWGLQ